MIVGGHRFLALGRVILESSFVGYHNLLSSAVAQDAEVNVHTNLFLSKPKLW